MKLTYIDVENGIDERLGLNFLEKKFTGNPKCRYLFSVCASGFAALDILRSSHFELLIVHNTEKELCGDGLMRIVRNLGDLTPAVLLTEGASSASLLDATLQQEVAALSESNADEELHKVLQRYSRQRGYADILLYPFNQPKLDAVVEGALTYAQTAEAKASFDVLMGSPKAMPTSAHDSTGDGRTVSRSSVKAVNAVATAENAATYSSTSSISVPNTIINPQYEEQGKDPGITALSSDAVGRSNAKEGANTDLRQQSEKSDKMRQNEIDTQKMRILRQKDALMIKAYSRVLVQLQDKFNELEAKIKASSAAENVIEYFDSCEVPPSTARSEEAPEIAEGAEGSVRGKVSETDYTSTFRESNRRIIEFLRNLPVANTEKSIEEITESVYHFDLQANPFLPRSAATRHSYKNGLLTEETLVRVIVAKELLKRRYKSGYLDLENLLMQQYLKMTNKPSKMTATTTVSNEIDPKSKFKKMSKREQTRVDKMLSTLILEEVTRVRSLMESNKPSKHIEALISLSDFNTTENSGSSSSLVESALQSNKFDDPSAKNENFNLLSEEESNSFLLERISEIDRRLQDEASAFPSLLSPLTANSLRAFMHENGDAQVASVKKESSKGSHQNSIGTQQDKVTIDIDHEVYRYAKSHAAKTGLKRKLDSGLADSGAGAKRGRPKKGSKKGTTGTKLKSAGQSDIDANGDESEGDDHRYVSISHKPKVLPADTRPTKRQMLLSASADFVNNWDTAGYTPKLDLARMGEDDEVDAAARILTMGALRR